MQDRISLMRDGKEYVLYINPDRENNTVELWFDMSEEGTNYFYLYHKGDIIATVPKKALSDEVKEKLSAISGEHE